jgi:hypothetical protein
MKQLLAFSALLLPACAGLHRGAPPADTPVAVRSHNASDVDVYLLCGEREARWLGLVPQHGGAAYAISPAQRRCAMGLNFFLVVRDRGLGYWVGPIRPQAITSVELVIEKYAGLSSANLYSDSR